MTTLIVAITLVTIYLIILGYMFAYIIEQLTVIGREIGTASGILIMQMHELKKIQLETQKKTKRAIKKTA